MRRSPLLRAALQSGCCAALAFLTGCDGTAPPRAPEVCASLSVETEWELLGLQADSIGWVEVITVHPDDPDLLFAATASDYSGGTRKRLYRSTDSGTSFEAVVVGGAGGGGFTEVVVDPHNPDRVYTVPDGILRSDDRGETWTDITGSLPVSLDGRVQAIALDPNTPGRIYLGMAGPLVGGFYRSDDGGTTWTQPVSKPCVDGRGPYCDIREGPLTLTVSSSGRLFAGVNWTGSVLYSDDAGETWAYSLEGLEKGFSSLTEPLLLDRSDPDLLYAGIWGGSLAEASFIESRDGGASWNRADEGLPVPLNSGSLLQGTNGDLLYSGAFGTSVGSVWRRAAGEIAWTNVGPDETLTVFAGLAASPERGLLYGGGDGLWAALLTVGTGTEPGPCEP